MPSYPLAARFLPCFRSESMTSSSPTRKQRTGSSTGLGRSLAPPTAVVVGIFVATAMACFNRRINCPPPSPVTSRIDVAACVNARRTPHAARRTPHAARLARSLTHARRHHAWELAHMSHAHICHMMTMCTCVTWSSCAHMSRGHHVHISHVVIKTGHLAWRARSKATSS